MTGTLVNSEAQAVVRNTESDRNTWAILAGLRGLFAFIVLTCHVYQFASHSHWLAPIMYLGGFGAVIGFFVISGYSIAHSIETQPKGFYGRRIQRIYPLYAVSFLVALIPFFVFGNVIHTLNGADIHAPKNIATYIGNLFFLNGYFCDRLATNAPIWSLSIEVLYYVLAPLFRKARTSVLIGVILLSAGLYYFHGKFHVVYFSDCRHGIGAAMLAWAWLSGFVFYRYRSQIWAHIALVGIGTLLLSRYCEGGPQYALFLYAVSMTIIALAPGIALTRRLQKGLNYVGELSYPLYIIHYPIIVLLAGGRSDRSALLYLILPIVASVVCFHAIDAPFRHSHEKRG